jgi:copper chaperone CopZ
MKKIILIERISYEHCVDHVIKALTEINGVTSAGVNLTYKIAVLVLSLNISEKNIELAIVDEGYGIVGIEAL